MHKRSAILLLNLAHAVDHMFLLIFATAVATGPATSSRIDTSSDEKGDGVMRANTIAATNSAPMVSGSTT